MKALGTHVFRIDVIFEELIRSLPNGLHDAEHLRMQADYARGEAVCEVDVDVSGFDDEEMKYRRARDAAED